MTDSRLFAALAALVSVALAAPTANAQQPGATSKATKPTAQKQPAAQKNGAIQVTQVGPGAAWGTVDLKIFSLKYAVAQDLARVVVQVLGTPGRVIRAIPDARTNSLIVVTDPDLTPVVEALIARLDVPVGSLPAPKK